MRVERNPEPNHHELLVVTDPGIDDTFALLIAAAAGLRPKVDAIATYGNGPAVEMAANLHGLVDFINTHLKRTDPSISRSSNSEKPHVEGYAGADRALGAREPWYPEYPGKTVAFVHGGNGCEGEFTGTTPIKTPSGVLYERLDVPGTAVDVVSLGAVTELVHMLRHGSLAARIQSITIMGGAIFEPGNVTPHLEANFRHDPQALAWTIDMANGRNIPVTVVTLDLTNQKYFEFTPERCQLLVEALREHGSHHVAGLIERLAGPTSTYHTLYRDKSIVSQVVYPYAERRFDGPIIHDATAVMTILHPELFEFMEMDVAIGEDGQIGKTAAWMTKTGHVRIPIAIRETEQDTYWKLVSDYLCQYK